jgi:heptosyltransferase-2
MSPVFPRALVLQPGYLGDTVFSSQLVGALARTHEVDVLARPPATEVARFIPGVSEVIPYDKRGRDAGVAGFRRVARTLRARDYALVAAPHGSLRTALLARATRAPVRAGCTYAPAAWAYTAVARPPSPYVNVDPALCRALGLEPAPLALRAPPGAGAPHKDRAALVIGSEWETKRWPPERWAALADALFERGFRSTLLGGPKERALADAVLTAARTRDRIDDRVGKSVEDALARLAESAVALGGDTGLTHCARALGRPTVVLFGPTHIEPHAFERTTLPLSLGLPCQPCSAHGPRRCPLGHHDCMRKLAPEAVLARAEEALHAVAR